METPVQPLEAKKYVIPRYAVDHLLESFQIVRTELSELLDIPDTNQADWSQYAEQWWKKQSEEDQFILRKIITAMGSPVLISNIAVAHEYGLLNTRAVFTSTRLEDPAFLIGVDDEEQNYHVSYVDTGDEILATMVMYLDAGADFGETEFTVRMSLYELIAFFGLMDLYRRSEYIALLEHARADFRVGYEEIWKSVDDGMQYPDLRWALPFILPQLIHDIQPPTQNDINTAVQSLAQKGVLEWKQDAEAFALTDPGLFAAMSLMKTINKLDITSFGFNDAGKRARKGATFIRTDPLLWTVMLDEGEAIFSSIKLDPAVDFVREILSPTIVPAKKEKAEEAEPPKEAGQTPMCPKCGKPATWIEAYKRWYCYSCQEYLPQ
ncbi:transposase [archaeon]|nr:transposase [archaeon]